MRLPADESLVGQSLVGTPVVDTILAQGTGVWARDGWADLPGYPRGVFRPRLYWNADAGHSFFATTGVTMKPPVIPARTTRPIHALVW